MPEIVASVPKNVAPQTLLHVIKEKYNLGDFYCFDSFPFGGLPDLSKISAIAYRSRTGHDCRL